MSLTLNIKSKVGNLVISLQPMIIGCNDLRGSSNIEIIIKQ